MNKTCKDCIHYDACKDMYDGIKEDFDDKVDVECCEFFKDKDRFIELPCEDIKQIMYLKYVKKLSWVAIALKMGHASSDACRMAVKRCLEKALKGGAE